ncbi:tail fiber domain-containing protein [Leclercia sp.]|uniref:tail fiber domain-containing protein n=1 Tax=Leclercia sp. TaxID=1898428 RepID=UPI0028A1FB98|nr:tail fiber domain-containing protein [Leclercia sp.]
MANRIDSVELSRAISAWTSTINDASLPGVGSTVYGGYMKSQYTVNGVEKMYAQFQVVKRIEWNYSIARLMVMQGAGGTDSAQNNYFDFMSNGNVQIPGRLFMGSPAVNSWWNSAQPHYAAYYADTAMDSPGNGAIAGLSWGYQHSNGYPLRSMWGNVGNGTVGWANTALTQFGDSGAKVRYWYFTPVNGDIVTSAGGDGGFAGNYTYQKAATSDATLKHDIAYDDGKASYENIRKLKPCTFVYNGDYLERVRRGIIAQDALRDIDREYVKLVPAAPEFDENGNRCDKDDTLALDNNVIQMDTALALHHAIAKIETLTTQVSQLQAEVQALKA